MLPTGTVTFLMTDLEGSTGLVTRLGDDYETAIKTQRALIRAAVAGAGARRDRRTRRRDLLRLRERVGRRRSGARLAEYRDLAVLSHTAEREAATVEHQLELLDRLASDRAALTQLEPAVAEALGAATPRPGALRSVEAEVRSAAAALEATVSEAQQALGDTARKLRRTASRGAYRLGDFYAVPFVDSVGIDRLRRFDSRAEARAFAHTARFQRRKDEFADQLSAKAWAARGGGDSGGGGFDGGGDGAGGD